MIGLIRLTVHVAKEEYINKRDYRGLVGFILCLPIAWMVCVLFGAAEFVDETVDYVYKTRYQPFSFPMPMMSMATVEHRTAGQRGFSQTRDTGSSDDEGDGNHVEQIENRNEPDHQGKSGWDRVLEKYAELDSRLRVLEENRNNVNKPSPI